MANTPDEAAFVAGDDSSNQSLIARRQPTAASLLISGSSQGRERRRHRKSRQGCLSCKKRKIKCQETFPTCANCARLSIRCQYIQTSAILPQDSFSPHRALNTTPNFSLTDFQLFHHYLVAAYPHFPVASEDIWLNYITPISHHYEFLMQALLGLSASHLSKVSPVSFTAVAQDHRLKASKGVNEALSAPLRSVEEADAVIAACYALLLQSWYMDDGLNAFLILTRSCKLVSQEVRDQNIQALLVNEDLNSCIEIMNGRLKGAPSFDIGFIGEAESSLNAILPLCSRTYQCEFHECLLLNILSLSQTSVQAYEAHANLCKFIATMPHEDFVDLCESSNTVSQLLIAHFIALHLVMRPISCRERKKYTVTMYRIRMSTWIGTIHQNIDLSSREYLDWPVNVSNLHRLEKLESYTLSRTLSKG